MTPALVLTERLLATYCGAVPSEEIRDCVASCEAQLLSACAAPPALDALEAMTRRRLAERIAVRRIA